MADRKADRRVISRTARPVPPPSELDGDRPADGRIVRFRSQNGLSLAARIFDAPGAGRLPLLCLPGLSRNSRDFIALGRFFSRHATAPRKVVALDYRGRGLSDPDPEWRNYIPLIEAQDALAAAAALGVETAVLVGTSRGGIISMFIGALRPGLVAVVVLNDIGPVIEGTGLARIKTYLSTQRKVGSWEEAIAALREISGGQFPALSAIDWRAFAEAYFAPTAGGSLAPQFDPNLVRALDVMSPTDKLPILWPQFASLTRVPVLAIRGELSDLLSIDTLDEMAERHPNLEQLTVDGQGHAPLLRDSPTLERISGFVRRCEGMRA